MNKVKVSMRTGVIDYTVNALAKSIYELNCQGKTKMLSFVVHFQFVSFE